MVSQGRDPGGCEGLTPFLVFWSLVRAPLHVIHKLLGCLQGVLDDVNMLWLVSTLVSYYLSSSV